MPNEDQAQDIEQNESSAEEEKVEESAEDTQEAQDQEQSNEGEEKETEELLELPDGRKVDPATLAKEWKENFYPEFTRRSQKLRELERLEEERKAQAGEQARQAVNEDEVLKNVPPEVKEAIVKIVEPALDNKLKQLEEIQAQKEADRAFEEELAKLEREFSGKNGLPKFDREEVLRAMQEPGNKNFDPRSKFLEMHQDDILDAKIKEALKKQQGGPATENTGTSEERKPEKRTPKSFEEAAKAALARISSS